MMVSRLIANSLAGIGIDACIMTLPHYGPRRSPDGRKETNLIDSPEILIDSVKQAVMDVRRTARWLADRDVVDADRIGLCGTSLGGFIAALAAGIDTGFPRVALVMAGGDLTGVLTTDAREVHSLRRQLSERGITDEKLREMLEPIEPLTFADRLQPVKLLMVNGSNDTIVPPRCARLLAEAAQAKINWFQADHYTMARFLLPVLELVNRHFSGDTW